MKPSVVSSPSGGAAPIRVIRIMRRQKILLAGCVAAQALKPGGLAPSLETH